LQPKSYPAGRDAHHHRGRNNHSIFHIFVFLKKVIQAIYSHQEGASSAENDEEGLTFGKKTRQRVPVMQKMMKKDSPLEQRQSSGWL